MGEALSIGHGVDVHRVAPGLPLMLGCVEIPWDAGLAGHSDGDCAAHAAADAVLGAAGLGTLGDHFPSGDERWRDASGALLLSNVAHAVRANAWEIASVHVVVVAERPRLATHLAAMSAAMANALGVEAGVVNVGATTTDGLGLCGRGEGIAASAVALLRR